MGPQPIIKQVVKQYATYFIPIPRGKEDDYRAFMRVQAEREQIIRQQAEKIARLTGVIAGLQEEVRAAWRQVGDVRYEFIGTMLDENRKLQEENARLRAQLGNQEVGVEDESLGATFSPLFTPDPRGESPDMNSPVLSPRFFMPLDDDSDDPLSREFDPFLMELMDGE